MTQKRAGIGETVGNRPLRDVAQAAAAHVPPSVTFAEAVVFGAALLDALAGHRGQPLTRIASALLMSREDAEKVRETCDRIAEQQRDAAALPAPHELALPRRSHESGHSSPPSSSVSRFGSGPGSGRGPMALGRMAPTVP